MIDKPEKERPPVTPTHLLKVKERNGKRACTIGVGWWKDGTMSIQLNPCVVLKWTDDVLINLFPIDEKYPERGAREPDPTFVVNPRVPSVIVPVEDSKGHVFEEVYADRKVSTQRCRNCGCRVMVNIPYKGVKVDLCKSPCPEKKT